jgi:hypothetical protein
MAFKTSCAVALAALALAGSAAAEAPNETSGRYSMSPVDGGFLRLDKETGAVAMCARSGGDWACNPVQDHTAVTPSNDAAKLKDENEALRARVKALEESLETSKPAPPAPLPPGEGPRAEGPPGGKVQLPTDEEVDQALDYLERVYKKIRDRVKDLDKPLPPPAESNPKPDKGSL